MKIEEKVIAFCVLSLVVVSFFSVSVVSAGWFGDFLDKILGRDNLISGNVIYKLGDVSLINTVLEQYGRFYHVIAFQESSVSVCSELLEIVSPQGYSCFHGTVDLNNVGQGIRTGSFIYKDVNDCGGASYFSQDLDDKFTWAKTFSYFCFGNKEMNILYFNSETPCGVLYSFKQVRDCSALGGACSASTGRCVFCTPESDTQLCLRLNKNCGSVTAMDNCGKTRTISCGSCTSPNTCGGGGTPNVCGCTPSKTSFTPALNTFCGIKNVKDSCNQNVQKNGTIVCDSSSMCSTNTNNCIPLIREITYKDVVFSNCKLIGAVGDWSNLDERFYVGLEIPNVGWITDYANRTRPTYSGYGFEIDLRPYISENKILFGNHSLNVHITTDLGGIEEVYSSIYTFELDRNSGCFSPLININGIDVLKLEGTHYEMGYTHGKLLAPRIISFLNYSIFEGILENPDNYNLLVQHISYSNIPEKYIEELEGMLQGMKDSGIDLYIDSLQREVSLDDLKAINLLPDSWESLCSSYSVWGDHTSEGNTISARNLDLGYNAGGVEPSNLWLLISYSPSDPSEKKWVSVALPGLIGGVTAIREDGLGIYVNQLLGVGYANKGQNFDPLGFMIRDAIDSAEGTDFVGDVYRVLYEKRTYPGYLLHLSSPSNQQIVAAVIEGNYQGVRIRYPESSENLIVSTNHIEETKFINEGSVERYERIFNELKVMVPQGIKEGMSDTVVKSIGVAANDDTHFTLILYPNLKRFELGFSNLNVFNSFELQDFFNTPSIDYSLRGDSSDPPVSVSDFKFELTPNTETIASENTFSENKSPESLWKRIFGGLYTLFR